jgi:hypothetical protein
MLFNRGLASSKAIILKKTSNFTNLDQFLCKKPFNLYLHQDFLLMFGKQE